MQSVPITSEFESCSREVYSIQYYVIKFCQWPAPDLWFCLGIPVFSTNKTDDNDITEILLKVALNTINLTSSLPGDSINAKHHKIL
jgi:hypothetical protein